MAGFGIRQAGWLLGIGCVLSLLPARAQTDAGWPTYGGDAGGQRYSTAKAINRDNVAQVHAVWTYHTHALDSHRVGYHSAAFETTPVLFRGLLYLTTPFDEIIALDPATGAERWTYQPDIGPVSEGMIVTSRGVATWDGGGTGECAARVFVATLGGRLIGVDAPTGKPCQQFGQDGVVDVKANLPQIDTQFTMTSAPTILGDVIVVGSSISDNFAVEMAHGTVRAYDVLSGKQLWTWEPIPWAEHEKQRTGAGNAWSTIAADSALGLVYVPTGSASPDYYGGARPGKGEDADSVVALDAKTGRKVWAFQVVHHNLWDYDVPSEPLLFTWHGNVPAVAITTKMGMVFVLDRRTGVPLFPVEEKTVPQSDVAGEQASPTQPFSSLPPLAPLTFPIEQVGNDRDKDNGDYCRAQIAGLRYDGMYTPPSVRGSLVYPGAVGGVNWGSAAFDPTSGILYANVNRLPYSVQLQPRVHGGLFKYKIVLCFVFIVGLLLWAARKRKTPGWLAGTVMVLSAVALVVLQKPFAKPHTMTLQEMMAGAFGEDHSPQLGVPYQLYRHPILDHRGMPCTPGVWGTVSALNLQTGKMAWEQLHGNLIEGRQTGSTSLGGPMVTAGGLVFTAGTKQPVLQALDAQDGKILWQGSLPVPATATPMTYEIGGRQFVVIAAGGSGLFNVPIGDSVIGFALK